MAELLLTTGEDRIAVLLLTAVEDRIAVVLLTAGEDRIAVLLLFLTEVLNQIFFSMMGKYSKVDKPFHLDLKGFFEFELF